MVQEYGRYFGMPSCCLRGGCLTGPAHSAVELHGFLSYLVKVNVTGGTYRVFGYKGKQVRDNIHSHDVARFAEEFIKAPRVAEVYNCGGGRENSCSILEAFERVAARTGKTHELEVRGQGPRRRPHLLHQRPAQDEAALPELEHHQEPGRHLRRAGRLLDRTRVAGERLSAPWRPNAREGLTAAILAGGLGTRLRPVVADRPKVLAEVRGRPFLAYLLDQIAAAGIESVVLCTGHLGEQVRSAFGDRYGGLRLVYSREPAPWDWGCAAPGAALLGSDPVLVLNGDSFCDLDIDDFLHFHRSASAAGSMTMTEMSDTRRYGRAFVQADGAVSGFVEKADTSGAGWINAGVLSFSQSLLRSIPEGAPSLEREVLPAWADRGLYGYRCHGAFLDIGIPEAYAASTRFFESRKSTRTKKKNQRKKERRKDKERKGEKGEGEGERGIAGREEIALKRSTH